MKKWFLIVVVSLTMMQAIQGAQEVKANGTVAEVMLFRGQALVTRFIPVVAKSGAVEITVGDLPGEIVGTSLFVSGGKDIQVRAVRYHTRAVGKAPQKEVQVLDDRIAEIEKSLRENARMNKLGQEKANYLGKLESFVTPSAHLELSRGILNADTLRDVTVMMLEKREELAKGDLGLSEAAREFKKELSLLQRRRSQLTSSHSKTLREAVIFLDKIDDSKTELRLSYLVKNATWSPSYNIRGGKKNDKVKIELGALATQTSGEDWNGVKLTVSTAGAMLVAHGPTLGPLWLDLTSNPVKFTSVEAAEKRLRFIRKSLGAQVISQNSWPTVSQVEIQWDMNISGQQLQHFELGLNPEDTAAVRGALKDKESGLAVSYEIEGRVSLASRHDSQMVKIAAMDLPSTLFYEAMPLLTDQVYRYAEMVNDSDISLMEGRANVYLDGQFVGRAELPTVARGQSVTVGFGTDPQLRASREFVGKKRRDQVLGSKKKVTYQYRLVLDNFSDVPRNVRVLDRVPMETKQIKVSIGELKDPLCTDLRYVRMLRSQGILRWDIEVPANSARKTGRIVDYSFIMEMDAKLHVSPIPKMRKPAVEKQQFNKMMERQKYNR